MAVRLVTFRATKNNTVPVMDVMKPTKLSGLAGYGDIVETTAAPLAFL